jgi:hypothetical protein
MIPVGNVLDISSRQDLRFGVLSHSSTRPVAFGSATLYSGYQRTIWSYVCASRMELTSTLTRFPGFQAAFLITGTGVLLLDDRRVSKPRGQLRRGGLGIPR